MSEGDNVHPLVSNLLEQEFVPRAAGEVFRYDRDEMMRLRTVPLSITRPDILSTDFDGEDGKFSPFKWLEYRWEVEGIKNRPANKKLQDALRADCDENSGLSPQRRGFSSGCRAPAEEKKEKDVAVSKDEGWSTVDATKDKLFTTNSAKWRAVSTSSLEKFNSTKGTDFKLPFQKTTTVADKLTRGNNWKMVEGKERQNGSFSSTGKFIPARSYRVDERGEKIPEWADDPTTMDDMIELRGFDEPNKKKKVAKQESKHRSEKDSQSGSRPSSRAEKSHNEEDVSTNNECLPTTLPDTDAELCAILGLTDLPKSYAFGNNQAASGSGGLSGSRLSKFFNKTAGNDSGSAANLLKDAHNNQSLADDVASNPTLAKLFSQSSTGRASPQSMTRTPQSAMRRVEDIEKSFVPHRLDNGEVGKVTNPTKTEDGSKGNLLLDPVQQAQLMQKLNKYARQQEEAKSSISPPLQDATKSEEFLLRQRAQASGVPPSAQAHYPSGSMHHLSQEQIINAQVQQIFLMQLQQAYPNGVPPLTPAQIERMKNEAFRSLIARQHQMQAMLANANLSHQSKTMRPAMIPASVQRHMTKANSSTPTEEKREKERESEEEVLLRQQTDAVKKAQMQQHYTALINAMQNGLPMAALRQGVPPFQTPQQLHAIMNAQQNAQRIAMMKQQQNQAAFMKLMALQHQQQMQQNGDPERGNGPQPSSSNGASDILQQVGPIQTPLEKLLTAAGVQPSQFTGSIDASARNGPQAFPPSARPMSLEEIERNIPNGVPTHQIPSSARPMSLEELEKKLTEKL